MFARLESDVDRFVSYKLVSKLGSVAMSFNVALEKGF